MENTHYDQKLIAKISNQREWPAIDSKIIAELMRLANKSFTRKTLDGRLSSVLIYHQIIEECLVRLIKLSNLYIQAEVWPTKINLHLGEKLMFGQILMEHKRTICFKGKDDLIFKCGVFNQTRIKFVHKLLKFKTEDEIVKASNKIKDDFNAIIELYLVCSSDLEWFVGELSSRVEWTQILKEMTYEE
jgi:hypothetical protein